MLTEIKNDKNLCKKIKDFNGCNLQLLKNIIKTNNIENVLLINEFGLYEILFRSKVELAK